MHRARHLSLDNLRFLPIQSKEKFPSLLAAADIHLVVQKHKAADLVMPSKLGNILAAGRPFIATALPDTELGRVTLESQAGVLVPPEDAKSLVQAIVDLAQNRDMRKKMGYRARNFAEGRLGRDKIMAAWEDLLYGLGNQVRKN
jgi:colanic acid biosynthesis glycosyl transferase WcaI